VFAAMEDERIWTPSWVCIGSDADIPDVGDLLPYTVGAQAVHVQRDAAGGLIGRYNKAQHGGCRFVPVQCQTGTKTSCSFTSCGYSRDRPPIKGAALTDTSRETYQYLGLRPERLPPVPMAAIGSLLFVNLDPAWVNLLSFPTQPALPTEWAPPPRAARHRAHWHEAEANWKLIAQALASGDEVQESADGAWTHTQATHNDHAFAVLWMFPNLVIWRASQSTWVIVLQPTATGKTLCRVNVFAAEPGVDEAWREAFETRVAAAEQAQAATRGADEPVLGPMVSAAHVVDFCNRQVVRHVLTGRPGYQPEINAQQLVGASAHG
jgi:hypothetical protein